jgi:hypothetical protein
VDLTTGAAEVFTDQRRRGKWRDSREDLAYQAIVDEAIKTGARTATGFMPVYLELIHLAEMA